MYLDRESIGMDFSPKLIFRENISIKPAFWKLLKKCLCAVNLP